MQLLAPNFIATSVFRTIVDALSPTVSDSFLATTLNSGQILTLIIAIGGLLVGGVAAVSAIYFHHRKNQMWHETARIALEKGQPVPPMPLRDEELALRPPPGVGYADWHKARLEESRTHAFRGGLVLIGVGLGLHLMLGPGNMIGAIPGLVGVALIINAVLERFTAGRDAKSESRPPQT